MEKCIYIFSFWLDWGLNSGFHNYKAGTLLVEPHLPFILLWLFGDRVLKTVYLEWLQKVILPISASHVTRITAKKYFYKQYSTVQYSATTTSITTTHSGSRMMTT
jgi:hypothetical protein